MNKLFSAILLSFSLNTFALEVGDTAPCVVLNQISTSGAEAEHCIRDTVVPGQFKVLEFFSATCSDCQKNLPKFTALAAELADYATFRLVGIDRSEVLLRDYLKSNREVINVELALDTDRDAKKAYGVISTPTLYILNPQDVVVFKHEGVLTSQDEETIRQLVK